MVYLSRTKTHNKMNTNYTVPTFSNFLSVISSKSGDDMLSVEDMLRYATTLSPEFLGELSYTYPLIYQKAFKVIRFNPATDNTLNVKNLDKVPRLNFLRVLELFLQGTKLKGGKNKDEQVFFYWLTKATNDKKSDFVLLNKTLAEVSGRSHIRNLLCEEYQIA